ncbi:MAG: hypothetical protein KME15_12385 [Drouetiella hepatica Uher 2000/2452]|jgi:hypothetical protein|uniref:Uncharacterized protein n=1 Tax=Drouetiella hepatica Uher 2000/2452 TaxID=904376 RepID=A0A951UMH3_9CYAN|nr:hypothetical protein [Drouetiella hepatica Uher 2000/2452]
MRNRSIVASLLAMVVSEFAIAGIVHAAGIPLLNYTCPTGIEVHADEGGYFYINGEEAKLQKFSETYYEATLRRITVSVTLNPDGTTNMSYTRRNGANGICTART